DNFIIKVSKTKRKENIIAKVVDIETFMMYS
ncbi:hypothetical protein MQW_02488, partial [Staphylococcus aureus subsp. aureus VRS11b]